MNVVITAGANFFTLYFNGDKAMFPKFVNAAQYGERVEVQVNVQQNGVNGEVNEGGLKRIARAFKALDAAGATYELEANFLHIFPTVEAARAHYGV